MTEPVYCIIGATGFLGQHLLRHLANTNVRQVRCLSRNAQAPTASIEWVIGNLHEERALQNLIVNNSIVINLGFDTTATGDANVSAARILGQACVTARAQRLVHISTATVVGRVRDDIINESTPCSPCSDYERVKLAIENILLSQTTGELSTTVVRPVAVFGQGGQNLVKLAQNSANGNTISRQLLAYAHGMRCMNLVAAENVAAAITYLTRVPRDTAQGLFIVSDDDSDNNNYAYVESRLATAFRKVSLDSIAFSLPAQMLSLFLQMRGKSNINPYRRYSCKKLLEVGFTRPAKFEDALDSYAVYLATQWAQLHRISG